MKAHVSVVLFITACDVVDELAPDATCAAWIVQFALFGQRSHRPTALLAADDEYAHLSRARGKSTQPLAASSSGHERRGEPGRKS